MVSLLMLDACNPECELGVVRQAVWHVDRHVKDVCGVPANIKHLWSRVQSCPSLL